MSQIDEETTNIQRHYAERLKTRLARSSISTEDARDGILDCFAATYHKGVALGLKGVLGIDGSPEEVAGVTEGLFRRKLKEMGQDFDEPTVEGLKQVKDEVDREFHIGELPAELQGLHDQVCSLLIAKAEGFFPHNPEGPVASILPPENGNGSASPARTASDTSPWRVSVDLRQALAHDLEGIAQVTSEGASIEDLCRRLARAQRLLETLAEFDGGKAPA